MKKPLAALAALALTGPATLASPTVIRDSRVSDLGTTPVLGRGYSISTNTFQSACLRDVVVSAPSYDFQYQFQEVDAEKSTSSSLSVSASGSYSSWWIKGHVKGKHDSAKRRQTNAHHVLVTLNMDTYYASVNEAGTPLGDSAARLVERADIPGFFAACGPFYVRGITRNAQFLSIFTYESKSTERDTSFEAELEAHMRGFFRSGSVSVQASGSFSERAAQKNLTITTRGWGLGKNDDASLISYDLETFKVAVKEAFISMQNPLTGRVTSLEVVPWVENTDFQTRLALDTTDVVSGRTIPLYEKKDILSMNGEFLAELERASRARLSAYYQARNCDASIAQRFSEDGNSVMKEYADRKLKNHRLGPDDKNPITLATLAKAVDESAQKKLWDEYAKFTYSGSPSLSKCIEKLMSAPGSGGATAAVVPAAVTSGAPPDEPGTGRGIFLRRYFEHTECAAIQAQFVPPKQQYEDYCMPELIEP